MKKQSLEDIWNEAAKHVEAGLNPVYKKIRDEKRKEKLDHLLELIDTYAETRHTCGCKEYNVKTLEAYEAVRQALKGR